MDICKNIYFLFSLKKSIVEASGTLQQASWEHPGSDNNSLTVQWPHSESEPGPGPGQGCDGSASDEANTPPPSIHPLPSGKQQISQNKRWRYESYRLWMLWKTRALKRSKDYKCCPPFYFQYKYNSLCSIQCMLLLGWPLIIIWRLKVLPPHCSQHLNIASDDITLCSLNTVTPLHWESWWWPSCPPWTPSWAA